MRRGNGMNIIDLNDHEKAILRKRWGVDGEEAAEKAGRYIIFFPTNKDETHMFGDITANGGTLPSFAWPGGYPLYYLCADMGTLCPDCANQKNGSLASELEDDKQWKLIGYDVNYEDGDLNCDHCNKKIEAAYV
jgi:hypothetical protein